jgi:hypothetical protein
LSRDVTLVRFLTFLATYENIEGLDAPDNVLDAIAEIDINIDQYKNDSNDTY